MPELAAVIQADAFALPFRNESFDVVVADPPYEGKNRGKKGFGYVSSGYVPFTGRGWFPEAWRVLRPSGHLYVFCAVKELAAWLSEVGPRAPLVDIVAWVAPNNPSLLAYWRTGKGGRAPAWRPVLQYQKEPLRSLPWNALLGPRIHALTGSTLWSEGMDPNVFVTASIQSNMKESKPWPNQLPVTLLRWLLRPHQGAQVLDLFAGTGTTRVACVGLGLDVVSVDMAPQAVALTAGRPAQMGMA